MGTRERLPLSFGYSYGSGWATDVPMVTCGKVLLNAAPDGGMQGRHARRHVSAVEIFPGDSKPRVWRIASVTRWNITVAAKPADGADWPGRKHVRLMRPCRVEHLGTLFAVTRSSEDRSRRAVSQPASLCSAVPLLPYFPHEQPQVLPGLVSLMVIVWVTPAATTISMTAVPVC